MRRTIILIFAVCNRGIIRYKVFNFKRANDEGLSNCIFFVHLSDNRPHQKCYNPS